MKPYKFVTLSDKVERTEPRERNVLLEDHFHGKWLLKGKALTDIIIRSGELDIHEDNIVHDLMKRNGQPFLPGSSVKGVVRSIHEAITYSCIDLPYLFGENYNRNQEYEAISSDNCKDDAICPTCQLFGYVNRGSIGKSLLAFSDFRLTTDVEESVTVKKIPNLFRPLREKSAMTIYQDERDRLQRKFYTHGTPQAGSGSPQLVIKKGAEFQGEITYFNLDGKDIGALAFSFGIAENPFPIKIGYGKPAYFGSIQFELENVIPYETFLFQSRKLTMEEVLEKAENYGTDDAFISGQKERLREIFDFEANKHNHWGVNQYGRKGY